MIVPMKKVSLVIQGDKKEDTLKKLRRLGLLHIEITEGTGERLEELKEQISRLSSAIFSIGKSKKKAKAETVTLEKALSIASNIEALGEEIKSLSAEQIKLNSELSRLKGWGEINPEEIKALSRKGVVISLFELPKSEYELLDDSIKTVVLEKNKVSVKCVAVLSGIEAENEMLDSLNTYKVELPQMSTEEIKKRIDDISHRIKSLQQEIASYYRFTDSMKAAIDELQKDVQFQIYATGMESENLSDDNNVSVAYFQGYIESEKLDGLKQKARENSWGLLIQEPTEEDNVPTKLKNNRFVSLIYPLTDFLGTVPGYFEYDISGWFLAFILIFFGIIFGDGGYGLFVLTVVLLLIIKSFISKKKVSPAFWLVGMFGLSTVLWGTLTCTWFGLPVESLPEWLKNLSVPVISNVYADKIWHPFWTEGEVGLTTAQNLQILCFSLALAQLTAAHIIGAARNRKSLKMLGDIGSIFQLAGIFYIVLSLVVNSQVFSFGLIIGGIPIGTVSVALIGVGFVLSFVFANYQGSIIKSVLSSCTNIVSVLLGVVNVFSDIVSYIRLWAVGLAGAAISATVNELAGPLLGNFMFMILAIILLVFGHGLNMILNVLSVIVHGIRLNTLEFSSHLGMSWSGHKFKPFEE